MRTVPLLRLLLASLLSAAAAAAADGPAEAEKLAEMSLEELLDVPVTSASKFEQKQSDAPNVVTLISHDQFVLYDWQTPNDVLGHQKGFSLSKDFDRVTVSSRGLWENWNNNHLLILVDGLPVNDNLYGSALTWDPTPLFFVKSMEVITGPGSALYGSNATNGVVALNTFSGDDFKDRVEAHARVGSLGTRSFDAITGVGGGVASAVIGFSHSETDGNQYMSYDGSGRTDPAGNLEKFQTRDNRTSNFFFTKIDGQGLLAGFRLAWEHQAWSFQTGHGWLFQIPDYGEQMGEDRDIVSLSYHRTAGPITQEYAVQFQRHHINWDLRALPNGATYFISYPQGAWEYLDTSGDSGLARAQITYELPEHASLLGGVESSLFLYTGDNEHWGTFNPDFTPSQNGVSLPLGPWLEPAKNHPITNLAGYAQYASGGMLGKYVTLTVGARFDAEFFNYTPIVPSRGLPDQSRSFSQFSPRVGLVMKPIDDLSIKVLGGRAFRAPEPIELFFANTFTGAASPDTIRPEVVTTGEISAEYRASRSVNVKVNGFLTRLVDETAYNSQTILLENIYSLTTVGVEGEVQVALAPFTAFANYSYAQRTRESISDPGVAASADSLTWAPQQVINLGGSYRSGPLTVSLMGHYQGQVNRRASDLLTAANVALRGQGVDAWFNVDAVASWAITSNFEARLSANNLFDTAQYYAKTSDYPFDYRLEGRRLFAGLGLKL
jgi:iron complex outermembrane receptor protein